MQARLPDTYNAGLNVDTRLAASRYLAEDPAFRLRMGVVRDRRNFWTGEGLGIDDLLAAAAGGGRVYADKQLVVTRTMEPPGLRFSGEIDASNSTAVADMLETSLVDDESLHLDVSGLIFCDIAGIRAFVDAAESLQSGRLLLHGMPPLLRTVMKATGWSEISTMQLCDCGMDAR